MKPLHYTASALALGLALMGNAQAVTTIPFWHSMEGELGKEVDSLAQRFNAENPDYKIVPTYKGNYEQNLSAGIAAFRTGNAPAILQVYEVGTATMMASKAIKPVYDVFKEAGIQFDESQFVPTVSGYYSDSKTGHLLSQPFNSSTPVLYYNKDAFKKAGLDPEQPPKTWQDLADYAAKLKASGMKLLTCLYHNQKALTHQSFSLPILISQATHDIPHFGNLLQNPNEVIVGDETKCVIS